MFFNNKDKIVNIQNEIHELRRLVLSLQEKIESQDKRLKQYEKIFGIKNSIYDNGAFSTIVSDSMLFGHAYLAATKLNNLIRFLGVEQYHKEAESGFRKIKK